MSVELEGGRPAVTWLDVGSAAFAEPFFHQTIERVHEATPVVAPCEDFRAASSPSRQPAGFIFHISRCGSTLVSQLMKEIAGVRVYSEPAPINQALFLTSQLGPGEGRHLLEALIRSFCPPSSPVFFKCSSWNILQYPLFEELFPGVPKLFVVRRPVEVLASIAKSPPGFVLRRDVFADAVRRRAGRRAGSLDDLEYAAVLLSLFLDAMAAAVNDSVRVLDYSELPSAVWRALPRFFGIDESAIAVARMKSVSRFHSKSHSVRIRFRKEEESAPHRALLERHVETWIGSRYDDLLASRGSNIDGGH